MTEVADFFGCKSALFGTEFELCVAKTLEDLSKADEVLFPGGGEDDDVVQVKEAGIPRGGGGGSQDAVHESGELSVSVAEAKRDLIEFE